jgi:hypothetical protein
MENETKNTATVIEAAKAATAKPAVKKAAKPAVKKAAKPAVKKAAKPAVKKAAKPVVERKTSLFSLASKVKVEDLGAGQRALIAKLLKKTGGATRATLIAALPDVPPANISWHLSMMVGNGTAKKAAQK